MRTDRHDKATSRFSPSCKRSQKAARVESDLQKRSVVVQNNNIYIIYNLEASPYCNRRIFQYSRKVNPNSIHFILGLPELSPWKTQSYFLSQYIYSARELEYLQFYTPRAYFVPWII